MASYATLFPYRHGVKKAVTRSWEVQQNAKNRATRNIEKRLALPMAEGHWLRALEILQTRGTARGVLPRHWSQLLKLIVTHTRDHRQAIDYCRHMCYGGEMAATAELYRSIVEAFCQRGLLAEAVETAREGDKRLGFSQADKNCVGLDLLRLSAAKGDVATAEAVVEGLLSKDAQNAMDVQQLLKATRTQHRNDSNRAAAAARMRASPLQSGGAEENADFGRACVEGLSSLPPAERQDALNFLCGTDDHDQAQWSVALRCWQHLGVAAINGNNSILSTSQQRLLFHRALNALGAAGRWREAIGLMGDLVVDLAPASPTARHCWDGQSIQLLFATLDKAVHERGVPPSVVTRAFDEMSFSVENLVVRPLTAAVVARCLARQGQWQRALVVLSNYKHVLSSPTSRTPTRDCPLGEAPCVVLRSVLEEIATSGDGAGRECQAAVTALCGVAIPTSPSSNKKKVSSSWVEFWKEHNKQEQGTSLRPHRFLYVKDRRAAAFKDDGRLVQHLLPPFGEFQGDASATPKYAPGSYNDFTSGWSYFPWQFHKTMPEHSRKVANPLSMWPKYMPGLTNPYRSWSLTESSAHAHRTPVRKWNGRSKV